MLGPAKAAPWCSAGLPVIPEIITSALPTGASSAYKIFYALRLLRLLRVARLFTVRRPASLPVSDSWLVARKCMRRMGKLGPAWAAPTTRRL
jgi:hypothetical protein